MHQINQSSNILKNNVTYTKQAIIQLVTSAISLRYPSKARIEILKKNEYLVMLTPYEEQIQKLVANYQSLS